MLSMSFIQIIGKGGMAREVVAYYKSYWHKKYKCRSKVVMGEYEEIENFSNNENTIIAIGSGAVRKAIAEKYDFNYDFLNFGKTYSSNYVGDGSIICPGSILTTNITIGKHVIINLNCTIHHDVKIGNFSTISPGVNLCGNVKVGELCFIGANSVIREKISICDNVTIGAGAVVVKDITEPGIYIGNPCKIMNKNESNDKNR